ncbi:MAG: transposase [Burkholderiales bacterium]|nr:transposase [Bacteroidia bacterium]
MSSEMGAGTTDASILLGAIIIKHHETLCDEGTIEAIKENIYMQYFLGLSSFKKTAVFAPSLFVEIRKKLGLDYWNEVNDIIVNHNFPEKKGDDDSIQNEETIKIDAIIVIQDIQYPKDLIILNELREKLGELINLLKLPERLTC